MWTHREARVNGVRLHYVEAGSGPLVVLLHGFPEFWYSWRHQIPALARAGFRVIAPDMRGYNLSEKPRGLEAYRIGPLVEDVAGLIRHAGTERATVVGHDWGGGVAWSVPIRRPDVIDRLVILNAPHPALFAREIRTPGQLLRSWYMFFFQLPRIPEALIRADDFRAFRMGMPREDQHLYREAWARPGALTASLNYYRALRFESTRPAVPRILAPTLVIWGMRDLYLGPRLLEGLEEWVPDLRIVRIPEATHWVQVVAPERVNRALLDFLTSSGGSA